jgi:hypothetical protein
MGWLSRSVCLLAVALAVALAVPGVAGAATGDRLWRRLVTLDPALGLANPADGRVALSARTGDVYVAGDVRDAADEGDLVVARYSLGGTLKWVRSYDVGASEQVSDVATDTFGNVILCGTSYSEEKGWIGFSVKYSRSGTRRWVRRIDGPGNYDAAMQTVCGTDGVVYVAGIYGSATSGWDSCLVKYRADGKRLWQRIYTKSDGAYQLARGPGGKLYVGAARYEESEGGGVIVLRYSPNGTRDWVRAVGPPTDGAQFIWGLGVSRAGVCVTGQLENDGSLMGYALKLRLDGTVHWQRAIAYGFYKACGIDGDGRVTVAGSDGSDFILRRFSAVGRPAGVAEWRGSDETHASGAEAIAVTPGGSVFATGYILNNDTGYEVWNVGMDAAWQPLFTVSYGSPTWQNDFGHDIVLASDSFYVAGVSDGMLVLLKFER